MFYEISKYKYIVDMVLTFCYLLNFVQNDLRALVVIFGFEILSEFIHS